MGVDSFQVSPWFEVQDVAWPSDPALCPQPRLPAAPCASCSSHLSHPDGLPCLPTRPYPGTLPLSSCPPRTPHGSLESSFRSGFQGREVLLGFHFPRQSQPLPCLHHISPIRRGPLSGQCCSRPCLSTSFMQRCIPCCGGFPCWRAQVALGGWLLDG